MRTLFSALLISTALANAYGQDTRRVTEPGIPPSCTVLTAGLTSQGSTLAESDENKPDTNRIQQTHANQMRNPHHQHRDQQESDGIGNGLDVNQGQQNSGDAAIVPCRQHQAKNRPPSEHTERKNPCVSPPITDAASTNTMAQSTQVISLRLSLQTSSRPVKRRKASRYLPVSAPPLRQAARRGSLLVPVD